TYPAHGEDNSQDFLVDASARRVYTMDGGVYGVGVTDMDSKAQTVWPFGDAPYGLAVAALPGGPVFGASGGGIFEFDAGGVVRAQYATPAGVAGEALKITPNGHVLYANATGDNSSEFGILGAGSLFIDDTPLASFTASLANGGVTSFDASASLPGQPGE